MADTAAVAAEVVAPRYVVLVSGEGDKQTVPTRSRHAKQNISVAINHTHDRRTRTS